MRFSFCTKYSIFTFLGAFSWERFQIELIGAPTKKIIQKENDQLRVCHS